LFSRTNYIQVKKKDFKIIISLHFRWVG